MVVDGIQYVIVIAGNKDNSLKVQNNGRVYPIEKVQKDWNGIHL
jgi:DNA gyrase/topoisomerase IV subunit B